MTSAPVCTCLNLPATLTHMRGEEIRAARERMRLTQAQLAEAVGVGARTVGNWERGETVPKNRLGMLRKVLLGDDPSIGDLLIDLSDLTLLAELTRRAIERAEGRAAK